MNKKPVSLFIPGLWRLLEHVSSVGVDNTPVLRKLLRRSDFIETCSGETETELLKACSVVAGEKDLPIAAMERMAADLAHDGYWLKLNPVNFEEDKSFLMMSYPEALSLQLDEARELAESINRHFSDDGWQIDVSDAYNWYLRVDKLPGISTTPLWRVVGKDILQYLPGGDNAARWRGWLTEIQMLLHMHPVNQQRAEKGLKQVNGVWVWGGGLLPDVQSQQEIAFAGNNRISQALSMMAGQAQPADWQDVDLQVAGQIIIYLDSAREALLTGSIDQAAKILEDIEQGLVTQLHVALKSGSISNISIIDCPGYRVGISRSGLWKWWRKKGVPHT